MMTPTLITPDIIRAYSFCRASYDPNLMPPLAKPFYHTWGEFAGFLFMDYEGVLWRVWRGTDIRYMFDWLHDADCKPDATGVHSGVLKHYQSALPSMLDVLQTFPRDARIRDSGHSLGGAMAELSWSSTVNGLDPITFCAMRLFTRSRAATLARGGIRIVNERDIVPHYPGRLGLWDYAHRPPALRFCGDSFELLTAHSLEKSVGPAIEGRRVVEGPLEID